MTTADDALNKDDEVLAPLKYELEQAIKRVEAGESVEQVLSSIIGTIPPQARAAFTRRLKFSEQKDKVKTSLPQIQQEEAQVITRPRRKFSLASAALLMATGTFDKIRNLLLKRPDIAMRIQEIGQRMVTRGVEADLVLLERLETVRAQAVERMQQQQQQARGQQMQRSTQGDRR